MTVLDLDALALKRRRLLQLGAAGLAGCLAWLTL